MPQKKSTPERATDTYGLVSSLRHRSALGRRVAELAQLLQRADPRRYAVLLLLEEDVASS